MGMKLKLISENPMGFNDFEIVEEQSNRNAPSSLYVQGPFIGCNQKNKNGRYYDMDNTRMEVNRYIQEMVKENRALGELNHPSSAEVNLERACHMVVELREEGNSFFGKSKVLGSTPMGAVLKGLINEGVKVGMSTRALGSLKESSDYNIVQNMHLIAVDAVADPSYSSAFVNGILESKSYIIESDGRFQELYDDFESSLIKLPKKEMEAYLFEQVMKFINAI